MADQQLYDRIGAGYASRRRADPRWAAAVRAALGDASNVLNVGAGAGSYEPHDIPVTAIDPSVRMLSQRPSGAARAIAAAAEALPFRDGAFDTAMATLTLHHWKDWRGGLTEVKRVARRRLVILTADVFRTDTPFWLFHYFPEIHEWDLAHVQRMDDLLAELPGARVEALPVTADCTDGFLGAFWRRPEAYLDPAVRRSMSGFNQVEPAAVERGIAALRKDLETGEWKHLFGPLLTRDEFDIGCRLVVSDSSP